MTERYLLRFEDLHLGDIVLSADKKPTSKAIRVATNSEFSHVMLYVGNSLIHATTEGVYSKNPQRQLAKNSKHLKVLRSNPRLPHELREFICAYARDKVGSLYSRLEAVKTKTSARFGAARSRKQFCSRLVAQAYEAAGIRLVDNSDYCDPEEINTSPELQEVVGVVQRATPAEIAFTKTPDLALSNQRETYKWLNKARRLASRNKFEIQTQNDVLAFLSQQPRFDGEVVGTIRKTQYLSHYNLDRKANPHRYHVDQFMFVLCSNITSAGKIVASELKNEALLVDRFSRMLAAYSERAETFLEYVTVHVDLYRGLLQISEERLRVLAEVAMKIGDPAIFFSARQLLSSIEESLNKHPART